MVHGPIIPCLLVLLYMCKSSQWSVTVRVYVNLCRHWPCLHPGYMPPTSNPHLAVPVRKWFQNGWDLQAPVSSNIWKKNAQQQLFCSIHRIWIGMDWIGENWNVVLLESASCYFHPIPAHPWKKIHARFGGLAGLDPQSIAFLSRLITSTIFPECCSPQPAPS